MAKLINILNGKIRKRLNTTLHLCSFRYTRNKREVITFLLMLVLMLFLTWLPFTLLSIIDPTRSTASPDIHQMFFCCLLLTTLLNPIMFGTQSKEIRVTVLRTFGCIKSSTNSCTVADLECKVDYNAIDKEFRSYAVDENGLFCPSPSMEEVRRRFSFDAAAIAEQLEDSDTAPPASDLAIAGFDDGYFHAPSLMPPGLSTAQVHKPTKSDISALESGCKLNSGDITTTPTKEPLSISPTFSTDTQQSDLPNDSV